MPTEIVVIAGDLRLRGLLGESATAQALATALPLEGRAHRWGEEIYFAIPVAVELEPEARTVVQVGDLGFWPPGQAFCIFFGPTPGSAPGEIRPASAVNLVGRLTDDATILTTIAAGTSVRVERR
jgi:hypothetical protein